MLFRLELAYLVEHLEGCSEILSVGCGPAILEGELTKLGLHTEYSLRIDNNDVSMVGNEADTALYIISGTRNAEI